MTCYRLWRNEESKINLMDYIKFEIDNESSVVISYNLNEEAKSTHAFQVVSYNYDYKGIKLFDPRCNPNLCVSDNKLPTSLTMNADPNKGELWVTIDHLEKRLVQISSLHSRSMYKSVYTFRPAIKPYDFDENKCICIDICKIKVKETSKFMINLHLYSHELDEFGLFVTTAEK